MSWLQIFTWNKVNNHCHDLFMSYMAVTEVDIDILSNPVYTSFINEMLTST